jgi:hypothetical protein
MLALGVVYVFLALILVVPWGWVLLDAIRWDRASWAGAGRNKVAWVLFILLLPPFGVLAYLVLVRPELVVATAEPDASSADAPRSTGAEENPLLLMRRNTVVAVGLLLAAIALAGILGVLRLWRLA